MKRREEANLKVDPAGPGTKKMRKLRLGYLGDYSGGQRGTLTLTLEDGGKDEYFS